MKLLLLQSASIIPADNAGETTLSERTTRNSSVNSEGKEAYDDMRFLMEIMRIDCSATNSSRTSSQEKRGSQQQELITDSERRVRQQRTSIGSAAA